jgi:hypothetical protein
MPPSCRACPRSVYGTCIDHHPTRVPAGGKTNTGTLGPPQHTRVPVSVAMQLYTRGLRGLSCSYMSDLGLLSTARGRVSLRDVAMVPPPAMY